MKENKRKEKTRQRKKNGEERRGDEGGERSKKDRESVWKMKEKE